MAKVKIIQERQFYTFRSYFELPYEADDIAVLSQMRYRADGFKADGRRQRVEVKCTPLNQETLYSI